MYWLLIPILAFVAAGITFWMRRKNMSSYVPSGSPAFTAPGNSAAIRSEFAAIQTAVNSKADTAGDTFTGAITTVADFAPIRVGGTDRLILSYASGPDSAQISSQATDLTISATGALLINSQLDTLVDSPTFSLVTPTININGTELTATTTELNYCDGVTSAIQTQLNAKAPKASPDMTGNPTMHLDPALFEAFAVYDLEDSALFVVPAATGQPVTISNNGLTVGSGGQGSVTAAGSLVAGANIRTADNQTTLGGTNNAIAGSTLAISGITTMPNIVLSAATSGIPATATSTGVTGSIKFNSTHIYICVATNTWVRAPLSAW